MWPRLTLRSRAVVRSVLAAVVSLSGCGPALRHDPVAGPAASGGHFTLASFNVYFPASRDPSTLDLIGRTGADVIFLQEVSPDWESVLEQRFHGLYPEMRFVAAPGAGGLGVLSRWPLRDEGWLPAALKHPAWLVAVQTPAGTVHVLNVHLRASRRPGQNLFAGLLGMNADHEKEIRDFVAACSTQPTIVVGDFNEGQSGAAVEWLEQRGFVDALARYRPGEPTWRALPIGGLYEATLDHILAGPALPALDAWVLRGGHSDHWPLLARF